MSDTPRTDKIINSEGRLGFGNLTILSYQLERELSEAREMIKELEADNIRLSNNRIEFESLSWSGKWEQTIENMHQNEKRLIRLFNESLDKIKELEAQVSEATILIKRYRIETPLGNQPHMIAHIADKWLESNWEDKEI